MMYQCEFISCNKGTTLGWDIDGREVVPEWEYRT